MQERRIKRGQRFRIVLGAVVTGAAGLLSQRYAAAASATWSGASDATWLNGNNWSGGNAPGSTSSTTNTDTATFNGAGNGHTTITVDANRNIQNITFDTSSAAAYTLTGGSLLGTGGGVAQLTSSVANTQTVNTAMTIEGLNGSYTLANNATSNAVMFVYGGSGLAIPVTQSQGQSSPSTTLVLSGSNTANNTLSGFLADNGSGGGINFLGVTKMGSGTWVLSNSNSYSGSTAVLGGTLKITNFMFGSFGGTAWVNSSGTLDVTGTKGQFAETNLILDQGGTCLLDDSGGVELNRLQSQVTMRGGILADVGGSGNSSSNVGTLDVNSGANNITLSPSGTGSMNLGPQVIENDGGGTLMITGTDLGAAPAAGVTDVAPTSMNTQFGGGGGSGATNISIQNFIVGRDLASAGNAQYGFMTGAGTATGLRNLNLATEYATAINEAIDTGSALRNISLTSPATINQSTTTINSLRLDSGGSVAGSGTLTVNSGAVLALAGNSGMSVANVAFGTQQATITTIGNLSLSGNITGSGNLVKSGIGSLLLGANTRLGNVGVTIVDQGTLQCGATNQLPGSSSVVVNGGTLDLNGFSQSVQSLNGNFIFNDKVKATNSGSVVNSNANPMVTLTMTGQNGGNFNGVIGGAGANNISLDINGSSIGFNLIGANTYTGPTTVSDGLLQLDFSEATSAATDIISPSSTLDDGGEVDFLIGNSVNTQSFNGTAIEPGASTLKQRSTGAGIIEVGLGAVTRTLGAALNLVSAGGASGFSTSTPNANGIVGGFLTLNGTDWAESNGGSNITAPTYTNDTWSPGANVTVTTNSSQTNATANCLRFGGAAANTVTLSGSCKLTSGGILTSSAVGGNLSVIKGGTLIGATGADLIVNQYDTTAGGNLEIDSVIGDNGSATALTKAGGGNLILTGANTFTGSTYLNSGTLTVSSDGNLGLPATAATLVFDGGTLASNTSMALDNGGLNARPISVGPYGGSIDVAPSTTLTVSGIMSGSGALKATDSGTLLLTGSNTYSGTLTVNFDDTLELGNTNAAQDMTVNLNPPNSRLIFQSGITDFTMGDLTSLTVNGTNVSLTDAANQPVALSVGFNNTTGNLGAAISGSGSLTKIGAGTLTLLGTDNTYAGGTIINGGSLNFLRTGSLRTNGSIENNAGVTFAASNAAGNVSGSGTTTVLAGATLTTNNFTQGALVNGGAVVVAGSGSVGPISGAGSLTIGNGTTPATLKLSVGSGLSTQGALIVNTGSAFDLTNNHLIIDYGSNPDPVTTIRAYLHSGYNGGNWNGTGLISSAASTTQTTTSKYALGYADSADPGNPANLPSDTIEVKYTLIGDLNLDGAVSGADFTSLADNFGKFIGGWDEGDLGYTGVVNGADFSALSFNFGKLVSGAALPLTAADWAAFDSFTAEQGFSTAVPEPTTTGLLLLGGVGALARRRRRRES